MTNVTVIIFLTTATMGLSQTTRIGKHKLAETTEQWAAIEQAFIDANPLPSESQLAQRPGVVAVIGKPFDVWAGRLGINLDQLCAKRGGNRGACKRLRSLRDGAAGSFFTTDDTKDEIEWKFDGGKVVDVSISKHEKTSEDYTKQWAVEHRLERQEAVRNAATVRDGELRYETESCCRTYAWTFANGRLVAASIYVQGDPNIGEEIEMLSQVYGKPAALRTVPLQNAYGARWDCVEAMWTMPDGAAVKANEGIVPEHQAHTLLVSITSREKQDVEQREREAKPNPYQ